MSNMTWESLILYILTGICALIIDVGVPYAVYLIKQKVKSDQVAKIIDRSASIVEKAVTLINQTFVDSLKVNGLFDKEAQKEAFTMCKDKILSMLNAEAINAIQETFGDFDEWIRMQIESSVRKGKIAYPIIELPKETAEVPSSEEE